MRSGRPGAHVKMPRYVSSGIEQLEEAAEVAPDLERLQALDGEARRGRHVQGVEVRAVFSVFAVCL